MSEFVPYGQEWAKEMMKWSKGALINYLGELLKRHNTQVERVKITSKQTITESFVDYYINENGYPPTYQEIIEQFDLKSKSAAYARCRSFRHKMIKRK